MKLKPKLSALEDHINHYWVVDNCKRLFVDNPKVYGYPGIRPEIIIILKGHLEYVYQRKRIKTTDSILASHIKDRFLFDSTHLEQCIFVQFKPRSISSLLPFTKYRSEVLMKDSLCSFKDVFESTKVIELEQALLNRSSEDCVGILDEFFAEKLSTSHRGFLIDILNDLDYTNEMSTILNKTGYSQSTLERHVKKETGMTPKAFLKLRKYKTAIEEVYETENHDWQYYINKYNFFDQSHFIKTIKSYTNFTPSQLVNASNLLTFRPQDN